jgi:hypothetical protein
MQCAHKSCFLTLGKGERRELNPRVPESQPGALTTWLRSPIDKLNRLYHKLFIKIKGTKNETKSFFPTDLSEWRILQSLYL